MTDKEFREWIQRQPSCISGKYSEWLGDIGEWRNPACHVRRASTFGTGFKADYSCVAMTHTEHDIQTRNGELACLLKFSTDQQLLALLKYSDALDAEYIAGQWFDAQLVKSRTLWLAHTGLTALPPLSRHTQLGIQP